MDLEDALDDIELDDDVLYREEERREAIAWRKDVAPPLLVVGIGVLGSALLVVVSWALDS